MYNRDVKPRCSMSRFLSPVVLAILSVYAAAQVGSPTAAPASRAPAQAPAQAMAASPTLATVPDLTPILAQVDQVAQTAQVDLAQLRSEKWKTDSANRRDLQSNADLIRRNLSSTLPGMVMAVRSAPQAFAPNFRLYQNLNALNDVLDRLAEYAGAYGSKADYEQLARDSSSLDSARRALGERLYALAQNTDGELTRLRSLLAEAKAAAAAQPVRKVVVDDNAPSPKTAPKKKKKAAPASSKTSASSQASQSPPQ